MRSKTPTRRPLRVAIVRPPLSSVMSLTSRLSRRKRWRASRGVSASMTPDCTVPPGAKALYWKIGMACACPGVAPRTSVDVELRHAQHFVGRRLAGQDLLAPVLAQGDHAALDGAALHPRG